MKTISEYRSMAWSLFRKHWKMAVSIILVANVASFAILQICILTICIPNETVASTVVCVAFVAAFFVNCTIYACYLPNWYLMGIRKGYVSYTAKHFGRYIKATLLMLSVPLVLEIIFVLLRLGMEDYPQWKNYFYAALIPAAGIIGWWYYAVCLLMPYVLADREDLSVREAMTETLRLSDENKMNLFLLDMRICIVPLIICCLLMVCVGIDSGIIQLSELPIDFLDNKALLGCMCFMMLIILFVFIPVALFARARFYEDLNKCKMES